MGKNTELPGPSPGASFSQYLHVFINLEAPKPHTTGIFMGATSLYARFIMKAVPAHPPFLEDEDGAESSKLLVRAISPGNLSLSKKHCFIRTRDVLILII